MPDDEHLSRRQFLQSAGSLSGVAYLRLTGPALAMLAQTAHAAKTESAPYRVLGGAEAADLEAIVARIIPTTDTPGAIEAGVIHFFDNAFAGEMSDQLEAARAGLAKFNAAFKNTISSTDRFADVNPDAQDAFLHTQDAIEFFNLVRLMTIFGFFSMSQYGGNKDHVGWDLIGFEGHHGAWSYPFGYYDAE
jgi:gluconate 2-dehydrogenase gamma chain